MSTGDAAADDDGSGGTGPEDLLSALTHKIVGADRSVRTPGAVRWWPDDLAQTVRVAADPRGALQVQVETELARGVPVRTAPVAELLRDANRSSPLAVLAAGRDGVVRLAVTARVVPGDAEVGWLRRMLACQSADAAVWSGLAEPLGGERATSHPPSGPRDLPSAVLGVAHAVAELSWARHDRVDPGWVAAGLVRPDGSAPDWLGEGGDTVASPWVVPPAASGRWEGRDVLATSAFLELDPTYGPALRVRTVVPWAVPPALAAPLVRGLNEQGRRSWRPGLRSGWHALPDRPGVALCQVLPLGVLPDAVVAGPAVLAHAVRRLRTTQVLQVRELVSVVDRVLPPVDGPDPWLTRPRQRQANTGCS
jgi:hypothetical protein